MTHHTQTRREEVAIETAGVSLDGFLAIPENAESIVIFVHGSGSSRFSPRNRSVAGTLNEAGLATLLFDLLTPEDAALDETTGALRFDILFLAKRLVGAVDWVTRRSETRDMHIGLFGASTGAAAALVAAAHRPQQIKAIVSRGGRPDLAGDALATVKAPTLLIVGGNDLTVIDMNREAAARIRAVHRIEIVPGATHLFEEPGALGEVAGLARDWFVNYLQR